MQLSVIILNYKCPLFLEQCVLSVQKALEGINGEIIIIDNASSDDSYQDDENQISSYQTH